MAAADMLSWSRAIAAILLIPVAARGQSALVLLLLSWALLSDALDGPVARRFGTASLKGAQRDSLADCLLYCVAPIACWFAVPVVREHATMDVSIMVIAYLAPILYGFAKFRRLTSYHTIMARVATCLLAVGLFALVVADIRWVSHAAVGVLVLSAVEEIAISYALAEWTSPVRSWRSLRRSHGRSDSPVVV